MNVNPLKLQSLCCIISRTVGAILSKRLSGALLRQREVPFPKARNQEGTQVTLQVLPEISVLECLPLEVGWKHHLITAFLKEEYKWKTMLGLKKEKLLRLREQPEKFIKGTAAKYTGVWSSRASQVKPFMSIKIVPKQLKNPTEKEPRIPK